MWKISRKLKKYDKKQSSSKIIDYIIFMIKTLEDSLKKLTLT